MDVRISVLADYASEDRVGKLSVNGVFGAIFAPAVPTIHPVLYLVFQLNFPTEQTGVNKDIQIVLQDSDGKVLIGLSGKVGIPTPEGGEPALVNQIIRYGPLGFERFGRYEFKVQIEDEEEIIIPLAVVKLTVIPQPGV